MTTPTLDLPNAFQPETVEAEMYRFWESHALFRPESQPAVPAEKQTQAGSNRFSLVIPPPNVTGTLHMGHALDYTIQDILTRWHRMRGDKTLWMPGCDHAGIATQSVVERALWDGRLEGQPAKTSRHDLGKEAFLNLVWQWADARKVDIINQFKRLGISPDWDRLRFTLDDGLSQAVREAFVTLYERGLIYQGQRIVNWCPQLRSAISDVETIYQEEDSFLWHIAYPLTEAVEGFPSALTVATTRPETMFGDVAVAVHPEDGRYQALIGKTVRLPLTDRFIPIIADESVEMDFGTGCLKITPAHDANDFEVGQRHGLQPVWCLDEDARLVKDDAVVPRSLQGVNRFEARQQVEALLEEAGLLVEKKPHTHRVGHCQRTGDVIEPFLSTQWFVNTQPLAQEALAALERGEIRFIPERWTKEYLRWMTHIQDWCISRQLWWGHAIPAWTCADCGHGPIVSRENPHTCPVCGSTHLQQDPDVLDTWFSSGLWPFSTMGWPNTQAPDYQTFYEHAHESADSPQSTYGTDVLVTGFDIIFFWVARMTMFGHAFTGRSPFHTVFIHGLIRDEKGQKMSKSKGNVMDPVQSIEKYGCDGFRFALTSLIAYGGQDIKISDDKLEQGKLFANKLWNASRFVLMNLYQADPSALKKLSPEAIIPETLSLMDRWILSRYHQTVAEANRLLEGFRFGELAQTLMDFTWNDFCDWYVEYAKKQLREPEMAFNTRCVLLTVLDGLLRLLHPIMPYITEALWQKLPNRSELSISISTYPVANPSYVQPELSQQVEFAIQTIRAIRNIRQEYTVAHATPVPVVVECPDSNEQAALREAEAIIQHFVRLSSLQVVAHLEVPIAQAGINVVGQSRVFIPLEGLIDVTAERQRLEKKQLELKKEQQKLYQMMDNHEFLQQAPAAIVEKNKARLTEVNHQLKGLEAQLESLSA
ncbi:MAG: valine--tRNA ligase [Candidatus Melainabacteria bacterium]|nr:valine--tRNA ligase [Candidatus Melainabacteria bacterium]